MSLQRKPITDAKWNNIFCLKNMGHKSKIDISEGKAIVEKLGQKYLIFL